MQPTNPQPQAYMLVPVPQPAAPEQQPLDVKPETAAWVKLLCMSIIVGVIGLIAYLGATVR